jgi:putative tryptophan/tyrosine transport system substrate-binding protein
MGAAAQWARPAAAASAQQAARPAKVGILFHGDPALAPARAALVGAGVRDGGYTGPVELIVRATGGDPQIANVMATELVRDNVDVLVPITPGALDAVRAVTATIPIVAYDLESDPIGSGMVRSLPRPGGNITGLFFDSPAFSEKWLEFLKEVVPHLARVGVLWDRTTGTTQLRALEAACARMNLRVAAVEVRNEAELAAFMQGAQPPHMDALVMLSTPIVAGNLKALAAFTQQRGLPAITMFPGFAQTGGLMAYGPHIEEGYRQTGQIVARVLKGAKPTDIPIDLPSRFVLILNLGTARRLGLEFPLSLVLRADAVVE